MMQNTIIVNGLNLKRIAITCRCGNRWVETVPGELLAGGAVPLFKCAKCNQDYVIRDGQLARIPDLHSLINAEPPVETGINDAELNDTGACGLEASNQSCRLCGGSMSKNGKCGQCGTPANSNSWSQEPSKAVN